MISYDERFKSIGNLNEFKDELKRSHIVIFGSEVMFRHRSFLEYFLGLYINKNRDSENFGKINNFLVKLFFSDKWSEVILYYIGFNTEIKKELLEKIFSYGQEHAEYSFHKLMSGRLLQAGWHTETAVKEFGIENAIKYTESARGYLIDIFNKSNNSQLSQLLIDTFILLQYEESFSSTFIHRENNIILEKILNNQSSFSYLEVIGLFAANKRFMNPKESNKIR
jgi:hypothetical protein